MTQIGQILSKPDFDLKHVDMIYIHPLVLFTMAGLIIFSSSIGIQDIFFFL